MLTDEHYERSIAPNQFRTLSYIFLKERKQVRLLLASGIILGILVGFVGGLFQLSIKYIGQFKNFLFTFYSSENIVLGWSIPIVTTVIFVVSSIWLVKKFAPEAAGSGVQEIEGTLENKRIIRWKRVLPTKFIAGSLSLSSGFVLGREGPTIQMGGSLGKMLSRVFYLGPEHTHILIAAGAGAGLAAAFNAPLAGILFVVEEMHSQFKWSFKSLQCVIVTAAFSDIVVRIMMGSTPDIMMTHFVSPSLSSLWIFVVFGCFFGVMGVIFNKYLIDFLNFFGKLKGASFWLTIVGVGILFGVLSKVWPDIIGGGYGVIPKALHYDILPSMLILVFVLRMISTWISYGTGVPGGIFAPMLALGTTFGMAFGYYANLFFPETIHQPGMFAVAGMSALFTATVGAPLTGIILVVEMTMNYALIMPLILTCFSATMVTYLLGSQPIYSTLLKRTLKIAEEQKAQKKREQKLEKQLLREQAKEEELEIKLEKELKKEKELVKEIKEEIKKEKSIEDEIK